MLFDDMLTESGLNLVYLAAQARTLLEQTDLPVEAIAVRVGLTSAVDLRRRFRTQVGTTPGAYRRAFRVP
ncbi:helix-turn-helix domain-containing protein [Nocardia abscessus]|uniref:helix-turn-helix domain-containing protein n=1 Tax=Nocardia abscessus TaxID=120957 RepID=UPI002457972D|nr:helix-turn-helix domain-containing protein [Nocardia abscessus]